MALVEPPVVSAPAYASAPRAEERRIVVADDDRLVDAPIRQTVAFERTAAQSLAPA